MVGKKMWKKKKKRKRWRGMVTTLTLPLSLTPTTTTLLVLIPTQTLTLTLYTLAVQQVIDTPLCLANLLTFIVTVVYHLVFLQVWYLVVYLEVYFMKTTRLKVKSLLPLAFITHNTTTTTTSNPYLTLVLDIVVYTHQTDLLLALMALSNLTLFLPLFLTLTPSLIHLHMVLDTVVPIVVFLQVGRVFY